MTKSPPPVSVRIGSALDSAIAYLSPKWAANRARARLQLSATRRYEGAARGRRTEHWLTGSGSANSEIERALNQLRARSRDLVRNNPYAANAVTAIAANTIGKGIVPQAKGANRARVARAESAWREWANTTACDADGCHDFAGLQHLIMRTVVESGECLIRRNRRPASDGLPVPLQLQVLEPDYLDTFKTAKSQGGRLIQGVEFDARGRRVAYHLFPSHPGETLRPAAESSRIDADEIIAVYRVDRPGQVRGVPWAAPVMIRMKDFDDFEDAFLFRQKLANCVTAFIHDPDPGASYASELPDKLEPGAVEILPPGKDIRFNDPPAPAGYRDYVVASLHAQAIGWGITYEALTGDYSQVNFSSGRMGHLMMGRNIASWQWHMFIPRVCDGVAGWFLDALALTGVATSGLGFSWTAPRREMVDPSREIPPIRDSVRSLFLSPQRAAQQLGMDFDELMEEWKMAAAAFDRDGLIFDTDPRKNKPAERAEPTDT